jgi:hypothetical protein
MMINLSDFIKAHIRRLWKAHELTTIKLSPALKNASHIAILLVYNEAHRLPYLFSYYRQMGIEHFIIIDNRSTDHTYDLIKDAPDISAFAANGLYKKARFGIDWVNHVLNRYCADKWILHVDADEFLVYPHMDMRSLSEFTALLEARNQTSLPSVMIDMYSDRDHAENLYIQGDDPLSTCSLFDGKGYVSHLDPITSTLWIKGGVRGRLYFPDDFNRGPALNKTPLLKWKRHFAFLKSAHQLSPPYLNRGGEVPGDQQIRGALLHFKFLSDFASKLKSEKARQQHTNEYTAYNQSSSDAQTPLNFVGPYTRRYEGWHSLQAEGLIGEGGRIITMPPETSSNL